MKTKNELKIAGANAALVLALIVSVTLGCGWLGKKQQQTQNVQKIEKFKELRTTGTITSVNTGGSCMKKINGAMKTFPQVGFSYTVDGAKYDDTGCAYDSTLTVGAKVDVCYTTTTPPKAEICSSPSTSSTNSASPATPNVAKGTLAADIVGNWKNSTGGVLTFTAEGGFALIADNGSKASGTYRVADEQTVMMATLEPGKKTSFEDKWKISVSGSKMTLSQREGKSEILTKF